MTSAFNMDRAFARLSQRKSEVERLLAMRDDAYIGLRDGYGFHIKGAERVRLEEELQFVGEMLSHFE